MSDMQRILSVAVALLLILLVFGCGKDTTPRTPLSKQELEKRIEAIFYVKGLSRLPEQTQRAVKKNLAIPDDKLTEQEKTDRDRYAEMIMRKLTPKEKEEVLALAVDMLKIGVDDLKEKERVLRKEASALEQELLKGESEP